jgi:hypothetical protein
MMMAGLPRGRGKGQDVCPGGLAGQVGVAVTPAGLGSQLPLMGQGQEEIGQKNQQAKQGLPPQDGQAAWVHDRRIIPLFRSDTKRRKHLSANATELQLFFTALPGRRPAGEGAGRRGKWEGQLCTYIILLTKNFDVHTI